MKHPCAICGRKFPVELMVYSRFTRSHYCINLECGKRVPRPKDAA